PVYSGPVLDKAGRARVVEFVRHADELLSDTQPALATIRDWLVEHHDLDPLYDYQIRLCRLYWLAGMTAEAYQTAVPLPPDCRAPTHAPNAPQVLHTVGAPPPTSRFLPEPRKSGWLRAPPSLPSSPGEPLSDLGTPVPPPTHFGWLLESPPSPAMPAGLQ